MKLTVGEVIRLGETNYQIQEPLRSGAVTDVYLAVLQSDSLRPDAPPAEVVIKLVRDDTERDKLKLTEEIKTEELRLKIEGVRREAEVLTKLNRAENLYFTRGDNVRERLRRIQETALQRRIVALVDSGEVAANQPFLVLEKAPPAFERFPVENLADERRLLTVAHATASAIALAHQHKLALLDFDPQNKWDRIRLRWFDDSRERFELKIIDWNVTGGPAEMPQDLLYFGEHLYYFLVGYHLVLEDKKPPANLGLATPGWGRFTEGTRQLLRRLLHRDPRRRYQQAAELEADLAWWLDTLQQADAPNAVGRLQDRIWQARPQGRHDRVLAISDLGLRLKPAPEDRQALEMWARQARDELEKEDWQPIAHAWGTLLTGVYDKAAVEFGQQQQTLPHDSEAARLARLFQRLALAGDLLKKAYKGDDVRPTPMWEALTRGGDALAKRRWAEAQAALQRAIRLQPEAATWPPIHDLHDLAQAGLCLEKAVELSGQAEPRRGDSDRPDWIEIEAGQIKLLEQAVALYEEAQRLAPLEPDFQGRLLAEQEHFKARRDRLDRYRRGQEQLDQGQKAFEQGEQAEEVVRDLTVAAESYGEATTAFRSVLEEFQAIATQDPSQLRARQQVERLRPRYEEVEARWKATVKRAENARLFAQALAQAQEFINQRAYQQAIAPARQAVKLLDRPEARKVLAEAEAEDRLVRQVSGKLDAAIRFFKIRNLTAAEELVRSIADLNGQPIVSLPGGENLPPGAGEGPFLLPADLEDAAGVLLELIPLTRDARRRVESAMAQHDYAAVGMVLANLKEELQKKGYPLTDEENKWQSEAQQRLEALKRAEKELTDKPDFEALRMVLQPLRSDPSPQGTALREQAGRRWHQLVKDLPPDQPEARERVEEGIVLLEGLPVAKELQQMQELLKLASKVARDLDVKEGNSWPDWFGVPPDEQPDLPGRLLRLAGDLSTLREQGWRNLQTWAADGYGKLTAGYLAPYLRGWLEMACTQARARNFAEARKTLDRARRAVPELLRSAMSADVQEGFKSLSDSLDTRLRVDQTMGGIVQRLCDGKLSWAEASEEARKLEQQLPNHQDVPVDDLRNLIADLPLAGEIEQTLPVVPTADSYAPLIQKRRQLAERPLGALQRVGLLQERVKDLRTRLSAASQGAASTLCKELGDNAAALPDRPDPDPTLLLKLYWQARWWELVGEKPVPEVSQARSVARALLERATDTLANMQGSTDLARARRILDCLQVLNDGLARPAVGAANGYLPPLPPGKEYAQQESPLDPAALGNFAQEVAYLSVLDQGRMAARVTPAEVAIPGEPVPEEAAARSPDRPKVTPDTAARKSSKRGAAPQAEAPAGIAEKPYEARLVEKAKDLAIDLKNHLAGLSDVWERLSLPTWTAANSLTQLGQEAELHVALTDALAEAHRRLGDGNAMEGLSTLYREIESQRRLEMLDAFSLWLLSDQRQLLKMAFNALKDQLVRGLASQVVEILKDQTKAVERLRDEVLRKPGSGEIADKVLQALNRAGELRAREADSKAVWGLLEEATALWAAATPPQPSAQTTQPAQAERPSEVPAAIPAEGPEQPRQAVVLFGRLAGGVKGLFARTPRAPAAQPVSKPPRRVSQGNAQPVAPKEEKTQ